MRDPYSVLGVRRDAGADEIKAAWRTIAKEVHPDINKDDPGATSRFAEVGQAYDVLKDPKKRSRYDDLKRMADVKKREQTFMQQRESAREAAERAKIAKANAERVMAELERAEAAKAQAAAAAASQSTPGTSPNGAGAGKTAGPKASGAESPEDVISRLFRAKEQQAAAAAAATAQTQAKPAEASDAKAKTEAADSTSTASGTTAAGASTQARSTAKSAAPLPFQAVDLLASLMRRFRGAPPLEEKAPDLTVDALVTIDDILHERSVAVALPDGKEARLPLEPGITDGSVVRLTAQGLKLPGMQRGDVIARVRVDQSGAFRVNGVDIHTILPVSLENAVLGYRTMAPSPLGPVDIVIPAWSGSDQTVRVTGGGLPNEKGLRGDLVVEIRLMLWEKPDEKVTDLMRSMKDGLFL